MIKSIISIATGTLLLGCSSPKTINPQIVKKPKPGPQLPYHYNDLKYDEFNFETPNPLSYRHEIAPGVIAYLLPDNRLPRIQMSAYFVEKGYTSDSLRLAANTLYSSLLISAGGAGLSADKVADTLEYSAAHLNASTGVTHSSVSLDVITKDFETYLPFLQELVLNPSFDSTRLNINKTRIVQNIKHKYDHPASLAGDLYSEIMYGKNPYFWSLKVDEVPGVSQADLLEESKRFFHSDTIYIGISGDFKVDEMKTSLKRWINKWPKKPTNLDQTEAPKVIAKPGVFYIDKDTEQTQIHIGQPFVQRPHADYYPASIASYILGSGGFTSRLVSEVRSKHGLAYSIRSSTGSKYNYQATTTISLQTKAPSTLKALALIKEELKKLITEGPTDAEIEKAKQGLMASIPSIFKSPKSTMNALLTNELYHREMDHFKKYPERLKFISKKQIQDAYTKYFHPDNMTITLVGPIEKINAGDSLLNLSSFGNVKEVKISDLERRHD
jgi:zinc protease